MQKITVSIITPSYNSIKFIEKTIESIINQTYTKWELLITDDYSTDGTKDLLEVYSKKDSRIKVFYFDENFGPGRARNNSIEKSNGRFIAFCDSDDQWKPDKLEKQISFMNKNNLAFSFSNFEIIDEDDKHIGQMIAPEKVTYSDMLKNNYIGCLTAMYDSNKIGKVFMPDIRKRQDWGLWLAILKLTPYALSINQNLSIYRIRKNSLSSNKIDLLRYNWIIYRIVEKLSIIKSIYYTLLFMIYYFKKLKTNR